MGEEQMKTEDAKKDEPKIEEKEEPKSEAVTDVEKKEGGSDGEEKKEEETPPPPPPPEEIVMRVFMHCEGCARKVKRILKNLDGVEDVTTDSKSHKVVVKGKKAAENPSKVVDRVGKKTGRKVELLSPLPPPPEAVKKEEKKEEEEKPKAEEKKEEPVVITVVLKVHMHCEACGMRIKRKILKMKGVQAAETDVKASQVTVKGIFEAQKLVEHLNKKKVKQVTIVKQDPPEKKTDDENKEDSGDTAKDDKKTDGDKAESEKKGEENDNMDKIDVETDDAAAATARIVELMRSEHYNRIAHAYQQYSPYNQNYAPQIFSDENPNACSLM